jgi:hypothetical protein
VTSFPITVDFQTLDLYVKVELVKKTSTLEFPDKNCRSDLQSKVQEVS